MPFRDVPLSASLEPLCRQRDAFPIRFPNLGVFPEHSVVFAQSQVTKSLLELHRITTVALEQALGRSSSYPLLAVDAWMPHCTLIRSAAPDRIGEAVQILSQQWRPFEGRVIGIGILFPPETSDRLKMFF